MRVLFRRLLPYCLIFLALQTALRLSLLARSMMEVEYSLLDVAQLLLRGAWFDLVVLAFMCLPLALYFWLLPARKHGSLLDRRVDAGFRVFFCILWLFTFVSEHLFWTEFTTRFNFIAVDYLIYTQEVIGNIVESYPLVPILLGIALVALGLSWLSLRSQPLAAQPLPFGRRSAALGLWLVLCAGLYGASRMEQAQFSANAEAGELAANGTYNLFYAFWHNEIYYDRFYATEPNATVAADTRRLLSEENSHFVKAEGEDFTRLIRPRGPERHKNVVLVVMESMSADYMAAFGNTQNLTPELDALAKQGLFFTQTYATGTRTVRGLEAVTLSIPPTPGQSIIRRPNNDNLFSLGFVFQDRGYDTHFIYGGYGYFDNMNAFFAGNGFSIIDRTDMPKDQVQFANVWGICDEDMFRRAIAEADRSVAAGRPFMQLIMTTSNHRPYTYPEGRIDIAPKSGRSGGVKYADYSVGRLMAEAKQKPWFKDTVFVFVADHTAGAGGKAELDPRKYHIPMIFYAPGFIRPQRYEAVASQIDLAPILLGLLNFSYYTKFYGEDVLNDADEIPHAFISNYQKVALVKEGELTVLAPKRRVEQYRWPQVEPMSPDARLVHEAVAYYQSASWWREHYRRIPTRVQGASSAAVR